MADLSTSYMGLKLKNPIIVGASNLVLKTEYLKRAEQAGAAAVVYKSLFEEQIQLEQIQFQDELDVYNERNAEMVRLFPNMEYAGPESYLAGLREARKSITIPLIGSLNAVYKESWIEYAKLIEETGVDALELNFYAIPQDAVKDAASLEADQLDILREILKVVKIPVSVKLSPSFTNPLHVITQMDQAGAKGFVLFNRVFQPDIDINTEEHTSPWNFSNSEDNRQSIRFAGLLYKQISADICSNSGISNGADVIKMILAGASSVQIVSVLYRHKIDVITKMVAEINTWMDSKNYSNLDSFRGKLARVNIKDPFVYKRAQYVDLLIHSDEVFTKNIPV
jgi:dihydroorotate dehydrogenase (fumarate)